MAFNIHFEYRWLRLEQKQIKWQSKIFRIFSKIDWKIYKNFLQHNNFIRSNFMLNLHTKSSWKTRLNLFFLGILIKSQAMWRWFRMGLQKRTRESSVSHVCTNIWSKKLIQFQNNYSKIFHWLFIWGKIGTELNQNLHIEHTLLINAFVFISYLLKIKNICVFPLHHTIMKSNTYIFQ